MQDFRFVLCCQIHGKEYFPHILATHNISEAPYSDLTKNRVVLLFISKSVTIDATTHTFSERSRKDLSERVWVVALIVNRFRDKRADKRKKHQQREKSEYKAYHTVTVGVFRWEIV